MARKTWYKGKKPIRRRGPPLARKRRTWVQMNIDPCDPVELDHCAPNDGCCTDKAGLELVGQTTLQTQFGDRCNVRRILGDLWFAPRLGTVTSPGQIPAWLLYLSAKQEFLGLRIGEVSSQVATAPLFDIWDPGFDDLSEGQWKKTWQHFTDPVTEFTAGANDAWSFDLNIPASDVHTTGSTIPGAKACSSLASGSGQICIDTSIDCEACPQGINANALTYTSSTARSPSPWHVHIDHRRRISLRENQVLYLIYNLRHSQNPPDTDSFTGIYGNLRMLIEMG